MTWQDPAAIVPGGTGNERPYNVKSVEMSNDYVLVTWCTYDTSATSPDGEYHTYHWGRLASTGATLEAVGDPVLMIDQMDLWNSWSDGEGVLARSGPTTAAYVFPMYADGDLTGDIGKLYAAHLDITTDNFLVSLKESADETRTWWGGSKCVDHTAGRISAAILSYVDPDVYTDTPDDTRATLYGWRVNYDSTSVSIEQGFEIRPPQGVYGYDEFSMVPVSKSVVAIFYTANDIWYEKTWLGTNLYTNYSWEQYGYQAVYDWWDVTTPTLVTGSDHYISQTDPKWSWAGGFSDNVYDGQRGNFFAYNAKNDTYHVMSINRAGDLVRNKKLDSIYAYYYRGRGMSSNQRGTLDVSHAEGVSSAGVTDIIPFELVVAVPERGNVPAEATALQYALATAAVSGTHPDGEWGGYSTTPRFVEVGTNPLKTKNGTSYLRVRANVDYPTENLQESYWLFFSIDEALLPPADLIQLKLDGRFKHANPADPWSNTERPFEIEWMTTYGPYVPGDRGWNPAVTRRWSYLPNYNSWDNWDPGGTTGLALTDDADGWRPFLSTESGGTPMYFGFEGANYGSKNSHWTREEMLKGVWIKITAHPYGDNKETWIDYLQVNAYTISYADGVQKTTTIHRDFFGVDEKLTFPIERDDYGFLNGGEIDSPERTMVSTSDNKIFYLISDNWSQQDQNDFEGTVPGDQATYTIAGSNPWTLSYIAEGGSSFSGDAQAQRAFGGPEPWQFTAAYECVFAHALHWQEADFWWSEGNSSSWNGNPGTCLALTPPPFTPNTANWESNTFTPTTGVEFIRTATNVVFYYAELTCRVHIPIIYYDIFRALAVRGTKTLPAGATGVRYEPGPNTLVNIKVRANNWGAGDAGETVRFYLYDPALRQLHSGLEHPDAVSSTYMPTVSMGPVWEIQRFGTFEQSNNGNSDGGSMNYGYLDDLDAAVPTADGVVELMSCAADITSPTAWQDVTTLFQNYLTTAQLEEYHQHFWWDETRTYPWQGGLPFAVLMATDRTINADLTGIPTYPAGEENVGTDAKLARVRLEWEITVQEPDYGYIGAFTTTYLLDQYEGVAMLWSGTGNASGDDPTTVTARSKELRVLQIPLARPGTLEEIPPSSVDITTVVNNETGDRTATFTFTYPGDLEVGVGNVFFPVPEDCTLTRAVFTLSTAAEGDTIDLTLRRGLFGANLLDTFLIPAGSYFYQEPIEITLKQDQILSFNIDQIGTVVPGAGLVINLEATLGSA